MIRRSFNSATIHPQQKGETMRRLTIGIVLVLGVWGTGAGVETIELFAQASRCGQQADAHPPSGRGAHVIPAYSR